MELKPNHYSIQILNQLKELLPQLTDEEYSSSLEIISNNTIGKHVRHILEFYECLLLCKQNGSVNYDKRLRNLELENFIQTTLLTCDKIIHELSNIENDYSLVLETEYGDQKMIINSSLYRELVYNIEHAIHHFAIINIAIKIQFSHINIPQNFGIAESTIKYQQSIQCAQ